jgi:hypothetical protein
MTLQSLVSLRVCRTVPKTFTREYHAYGVTENPRGLRGGTARGRIELSARACASDHTADPVEPEGAKVSIESQGGNV